MSRDFDAAVGEAGQQGDDFHLVRGDVLHPFHSHAVADDAVADVAGDQIETPAVPDLIEQAHDQIAFRPIARWPRAGDAGGEWIGDAPGEGPALRSGHDRAAGHRAPLGEIGGHLIRIDPEGFEHREFVPHQPFGTDFASLHQAMRHCP